MKSINVQAMNKINVTGKLMDVTTGNGVLSDGRKYNRATLTVRVTQEYGGRTETSEIPVSMFAAQYTQANKVNPGYDQIANLATFKTAQNVGIDEADTVRISGANIRENNFVTKSGQLINGWQLNTSFVNKGTSKDVASFQVDIFIMDMHDEVDRDGDPTGRLVIKGGLVQYKGKLDVIEFIVESPDSVDYIQRNWNVNDTVTAMGRIRVTSVEETHSANSSWGEEIPATTTRFVRELIITQGDNQGKEEEFAYDPAEIKRAFNVRKALIEQMQVDATQMAKTAASATTPSKYNWE